MTPWKGYSGLPGPDAAGRSFDQPWEIRAFALAVAAYQQRQFEWSEFQLSLISSIREWEARGGADEEDPWSYYEHWLAALESVLSGSGLLSESALDEQTKLLAYLGRVAWRLVATATSLPAWPWSAAIGRYDCGTEPPASNSLPYRTTPIPRRWR